MKVDALRSEADITHADAAVWFQGISLAAAWCVEHSRREGKTAEILRLFSATGVLLRFPRDGRFRKVDANDVKRLETLPPDIRFFCRALPDSLLLTLPFFVSRSASIFDFRAGVSVEIEGLYLEGFRLILGLVEFPSGIKCTPSRLAFSYEEADGTRSKEENQFQGGGLFVQL